MRKEPLSNWIQTCNSKPPRVLWVKFRYTDGKSTRRSLMGRIEYIFWPPNKWLYTPWREQGPFSEGDTFKEKVYLNTNGFVLTFEVTVVGIIIRKKLGSRQWYARLVCDGGGRTGTKFSTLTGVTIPRQVAAGVTAWWSNASTRASTLRVTMANPSSRA
jgi:hypothetical protein